MPTLAAIAGLILIVPCPCLGAQQIPPANSIPLSIIVVDSASEAEGVLTQLKNGSDFAAIAKSQSIDATGSDGGFIGKLEPDALRTELREALTRVKIGQITRNRTNPRRLRHSEGLARLRSSQRADHEPDANTSPACERRR